MKTINEKLFEVNQLGGDGTCSEVIAKFSTKEELGE